MKPAMHVVSVSGGKDSTATLLLALKCRPRSQVIPIFCDTDNEHADTYAYLDYLERALGVKIERLRADFSFEIARKRRFIAADRRTGRDKKGRRLRWSNKAKRRALAELHPTGNAFLDLCLWKGKFPSRMSQFCTQELKTEIAVAFQMRLMDAGHRVISWQGIRRDESRNRRNAKRVERIGPKLRIFRPVVDWSAADIFALAASEGIQSNPLYRQGMGRVGCMPCINVQKGELRAIAARFPEEIARIAEWERKVGACSKRGFSTFLTDGHDDPDRRKIFADLNITARVEWSKTTRGGQQRDLLEIPSAGCSSSYGLCDSPLPEEA